MAGRTVARCAGPALVAVLMIGCSDDGGATAPTTTTTSTQPDDPTYDDLAAAIGCENVRQLDDYGAPIRGGAAADGASCTRDGAEVHLFVRTPVREAELPVDQGGSIENIDRLVATNLPPDPGECSSWVAVGETWFALASEKDTLELVADDLGGTVREILPTGPPASYTPPCKGRG